MGPFHRAQSFKNRLLRLLQRGSPMRSQIPPANHLLRGLFSMGYSFCQEPAPVWALHRVTASFSAHPPATVWGPPQAAGWISAPLWNSMGCRGTTCHHHGLHQKLQGNLCSGGRSTSSPSFSLSLVSAEFSLTYPHSSLPAAAVQQLLPFLKCYHRGTMTTAYWLSFGQRQVCFGPRCNWL